MKKKVKSIKRKSVRKVSPQGQSFTYRRIIIISAIVIALGAGLLLYNNNKSVPQSVLGASVVRTLYAQATITWNPVDGAAAYNVYYKQESDGSFVNAVRNIPTNTTMYTISYLKKNTAYQYKVSAINKDGSEFWWSDVQPLVDLESM